MNSSSSPSIAIERASGRAEKETKNDNHFTGIGDPMDRHSRKYKRKKFGDRSDNLSRGKGRGDGRGRSRKAAKSHRYYSDGDDDYSSESDGAARRRKRKRRKKEERERRRRKRRDRDRRKRKKRKRSYSSSSSPSSDDASCSSSRTSSSSSENRKIKKKRKRSRDQTFNSDERDEREGESQKLTNENETAKPTTAAVSVRNEKRTTDGLTNVPAPLSEPKRRRPMIPMSKEEYDKEQSKIREVYDPLSGRVRLVRGSGEIIERIVSAATHRQINTVATSGDGLAFSKGIYDKLRR